MYTKISLLVFVLMSIFISCDKQEGVGGTASIKGYLQLEQYNDDFTILVNSMPAADEKIYIQYGDDKVIGDDVETSYDGYFEFTYLYEGDYTLFYYSKDSANQYLPKKEVLIEVQLSKGESKDLGALKSFKVLDFDDGNATIKGNVYEVYFDPSDTLLATELPVYLRYGNHQFYDDRIRTQEDGSFYFQELIPGTYTIYVFSENPDGSKQQLAIRETMTIPDNEAKEYILDDFFIYNF